MNSRGKLRLFIIFYAMNTTFFDSTNPKSLKRSRLMYILEAGFEYLISILVAGTFLAKITSSLGISDNLTGIISSIISLGQIFQLGSLLIKRPKLKGMVIIMSIINQLLFLFLYIIPFFEINSEIKTVIFIVTIISAYLIYNIAHPKKINWFMSLVEDAKRGKFTGLKEAVSLLMGMVFTYVMGSIIDIFEANGELKTAFLITAITICGLTVLHTLTMLLSVEKASENKVKEKNNIKNMLTILKDKNILKLTLLLSFWFAANSSALPFYGTYQIKELGFSMTFVSFLSIAYSIVRIGASFIMGNIADKKGFSTAMKICLIISAAGYFVNIFTVPENGYVLYTTFQLLNAISSAGINSALINLVYDYVSVEKRADGLAVTQTFAGLIGFFTTLAVSKLVEYIQQSGNMFMGLNMYAQQAASVISVIFHILCFITIIFVIEKTMKKIVN